MSLTTVGPMAKWLIKTTDTTMKPLPPVPQAEQERRDQWERRHYARLELAKAREIEAEKQAAESKRKLREASPSDPIARKYAKEAKQTEDLLAKAPRTAAGTTDEVGDHQWEKHREEIEGLIESVTGYNWDRLKGQTDAKKTAKMYVDSINENWDNQPPKGVLLAGPPGTGKTTLAQIMACQMKCTFFNVPKNFASGKWEALLRVAEEQEKSLILIDECDGLLSCQHTANVPALKRLWQPTSVEANSVLIIGATNHPEKLEEGILSRFGNQITFEDLSDENRREIMQGLFKTPCSMKDSEWGQLLPKLRDFTGRKIERLCQEVGMTVEKEWRQGGKDKRPISLNDFTNAIPASDDDTNLLDRQREFIDWLKGHFLVGKIHEGPKQKEKVISLHYLVTLIPTPHLKHLGMTDKDVQNMRSANTPLPTQFKANLIECIKEGVIDQFDDNKKKIVEFVEKKECKRIFLTLNHVKPPGCLSYWEIVETTKGGGNYFTNLNFDRAWGFTRANTTRPHNVYTQEDIAKMRLPRS